MELINAKGYSLGIQSVLEQCEELKTYLLPGTLKIDLGNPQALQQYNLCLFRILEGLNLKIPSENNLIPTCGLRRVITSLVIKHCNPKSLLEIGTGAYAIMALLFAKRDINVIATEIDEQSFTSAFQNIENNVPLSKINLKLSSGGILDWLTEFFPIDCVVSLPPFYDELDKRLSQKGFLGTDSELYSFNEGVSFSFKLIDEWYKYRHQLRYLCILWKNNKDFRKGIDYLYSKNDNTVQIEEFEIKAGNRTRYFSIYK